jgi:hypothetical protein
MGVEIALHDIKTQQFATKMHSIVAKFSPLSVIIIMFAKPNRIRQFRVFSQKYRQKLAASYTGNTPVSAQFLLKV